MTPLFTACQTASPYTTVEDARFVHPAKGLDGVTDQFSKMFWVDATHVVFSATKLPDGWKAARGELPKVILYDVITGSISSTPYIGDVECFAQHKIVIALQQAPRKLLLIGGRFGGELHDVALDATFESHTPNPETGLSGSTCEPITETKEANLIPLRPGDGFVRIAHHIPGASLAPDPHQAQLLDSTNNKVVDLPYGPYVGLPFGGRGLRYLPYKNAYFVQGLTDHTTQTAGYLFDPSGHTTPIDVDDFMYQLSFKESGNALDWVGAEGAVVWANVAFMRPYTGLYVSGRGATVQVDGQFLIRTAGFSPDGCIFFYQRGMRRTRPPMDFISESFATLNVCS